MTTDATSTKTGKSVSYGDLPLVRPGPPLNAWGQFGEDDELGRLNLITPEVVRSGIAAVKHGLVINLNLPLTQTPLSDVRIPLDHKMWGRPTYPISAAHSSINRGHCNDDEVMLNTQTTSQWDGFRHFPYLHYPEQGQYTYYGGLTTEQSKDPKNLKYGIQNYADKPITSRAHLLDVPSYLDKHSLPPLNPLVADKISLDTLKGIVKEYALDFQPGDILVLHTGFFEALYELSEEEQGALGCRAVGEKGWCGVEATDEMLRWHWENGITAVATDTMAYESFPLNPWPSLHQTFLAGWGLPIGELFDTRELVKQCRRLNQYTFFFASMALNVPGGIASPPNAQAVL